MPDDQKSSSRKEKSGNNKQFNLKTSSNPACQRKRILVSSQSQNDSNKPDSKEPANLYLQQKEAESERSATAKEIKLLGNVGG